MSTTTVPALAPDGLRDLAHLDWALRHYCAARAAMASSRAPVELVDRRTGRTLSLESMNDVRILLYAAAAAYRGARSDGFADAAEVVLAAIRQELRRMEHSDIPP